MKWKWLIFFAIVWHLPFNDIFGQGYLLKTTSGGVRLADGGIAQIQVAGLPDSLSAHWTAIMGKQASGNYATTATTDSMRTNIYGALNGKQASGSYATTATTDSMRTNIYNGINGKQAAGTYATGTGTASGTNTGDQTTVSGNAGTATALQNARTINLQSFNGTANIINKALVANTAVITGTASRTISGAQIVAGDIQELTGTVGRTFTFDTGTNMSAAYSPVTVGDTFYILIKSSGTSSGTITLAGASGMTLSSNAVIAIGASKMCAIINTGSNAWTIY